MLKTTCELLDCFPVHTGDLGEVKGQEELGSTFSLDLSPIT